MMAFTELRSARLLLRRLRPSDAEAICRYRALPEVARYQSWEAFTRADAERLVQFALHGLRRGAGGARARA